jgi:hypothetical protein
MAQVPTKHDPESLNAKQQEITNEYIHSVAGIVKILVSISDEDAKKITPSIARGIVELGGEMNKKYLSELKAAETQTENSEKD